MRVLMIGPGPAVTGGISTLVQALLPALQARVDVEFLPTVLDRPPGESGILSGANLILAVDQYRRFVSALLRFRPDIVHLHTSQGIAWFKDTFFIVVGKAFGCRLVVHMHGGDFVDLYEQSNPVIRWFTRAVLGMADTIAEVSEQRRNRLFSIVPHSRILTFRNCIQVQATPVSGASRSDNGTYAFFLGVIGPSKGVYDLFEAMRRLHSSGCRMKLRLAGHEERDGEMQRAATRLAEMGLDGVCCLLGPVHGEHKAQCLREASVFVLPSYQEALPMAVLEAMAAGLPIIATSVGGIPEVVRDGHNGYLVRPGDVDSLTARMAALAGDPALREVMGRNSRALAVQELDVDLYVDRLVQLYESMLGS
jgi:glycosyltransferase involved in cell wall biosynthesis